METVKAILETNNRITEKLKQNDIDVEAVEFTSLSFVTAYNKVVTEQPMFNLNFYISIYRMENFQLVQHNLTMNVIYRTDDNRIYSIAFDYHTKECQRLFQQILES